MSILDPIKPSVTAMRLIASLQEDFRRELKVGEHIRSLGIDVLQRLQEALHRRAPQSVENECMRREVRDCTHRPVGARPDVDGFSLIIHLAHLSSRVSAPRRIPCDAARPRCRSFRRRCTTSAHWSIAIAQGGIDRGASFAPSPPVNRYR